jgi:hypothetical protein
MYKVEQIQVISVGARTDIENEKYLGHQWLLWDLIPSYFKG